MIFEKQIDGVKNKVLGVMDQGKVVWSSYRKNLLDTLGVKGPPVYNEEDTLEALGTPKLKNLKDKVVFITGGSRGIGLAIAKRLAKDGAKIIIAAKTKDPHPKLPGTIYTSCEEIEQAGGKCLPLVMDVRFEDQVEKSVQQAVEHFGGIDILINNASAIYLTSTTQLTMKQFDLMNQINMRGTFATSKFCLPYLEKSDNPHILTLSPPINWQDHWFENHLGYTLSKYGMSMIVKGLACELKSKKIAVNSLWPKTIIATAAIYNMPLGKSMARKARTPDIMAEASNQILISDSGRCSGNFFIDEAVLIVRGDNQMDKYQVEKGAKLQEDLFL